MGSVSPHSPGDRGHLTFKLMKYWMFPPNKTVCFPRCSLSSSCAKMGCFHPQLKQFHGCGCECLGVAEPLGQYQSVTQLRGHSKNPGCTSGPSSGFTKPVAMGEPVLKIQSYNLLLSSEVFSERAVCVASFPLCAAVQPCSCSGWCGCGLDSLQVIGTVLASQID